MITVQCLLSTISLRQNREIKNIKDIINQEQEKQLLMLHQSLYKKNNKKIFLVKSTRS